MKDFNINSYQYSLPEERIAQKPLSAREDSKLLVYRSQEIDDAQFSQLSNFLPSNSHLVFNETKVIPARLYFRKETGAEIEIFCLEPFGCEHAQAMSSKGEVEWTCLIGNAKRWKAGALKKNLKGQILEASVKEKLEKGAIIRFSWEKEEMSFAEVLQEIGHIPIPPYIKRADNEIDKDRYQSVMAKNDGAVAAPTASLHFSKSLVNNLCLEGIGHSELTLHVGAGTFKPIDCHDVRDHKMHAEKVKVTRNQLVSLMKVIDNGKELICVGTTALRSLESIYWLGILLSETGRLENNLDQEFSYENPSKKKRVEVLQMLINHLVEQKREELLFSTSLMIRPGYEFKMCKKLITNFHMPGSSLLLLVSALVGDQWKNIYQHALENSYRFLSYGDSSLLFGK